MGKFFWRWRSGWNRWGQETYLYATWGGQGLVARLRSEQRVVAKEQVWLGLEMGRAHFFDAEKWGGKLGNSFQSPRW